MNTHEKGDFAELKVALCAQQAGYQVSFPFGHDSRYDLIVDRNGKLERIQVKYVYYINGVMHVSAKSVGKKDGKLISKVYQSSEIDWVVGYDCVSDRCYFIPIADFNGQASVALRFDEPKNKQKKKIRFAKDYTIW